jgi:hypothetical protein
MRRLIWLVMLPLLAGPAVAQGPELGTPEQAFADGPITLTPVSVALLKDAYPGGKVPVIPMPFRKRLDTALASGNAPALEAARREIQEEFGPVAVLIWERTRVLATGSISLAAMHARMLALFAPPSASDGVAMMWFYAAAATMTDGARCVDADQKETALDRLRGRVYDPVLRVIRTLPDTTLDAAREAAIRLEAALAEQRPDDTVCHTSPGNTTVKSIGEWRPAAANTRAMLPRHLRALTAVVGNRTAPPPR